MGFISDLRAIEDIQRVKSGGRARLSISQITGGLINLSDARTNLSKCKFVEVKDLYRKLRKYNTKAEMNYEGYIQRVEDIISLFDAIAPYEKYSGGSEIEFSILLNGIRSKK